MDRQAAARTARVVEQILDEPLLRFDCPLHVRCRTGDEFGIVGPAAQLRRPSGQDVERRSPFVRDARDELVFLPDRRLGATGRRLCAIAGPAQRRRQKGHAAGLNHEQSEIEDVGGGRHQRTVDEQERAGARRQHETDDAGTEPAAVGAERHDEDERKKPGQLTQDGIGQPSQPGRHSNEQERRPVPSERG